MSDILDKLIRQNKTLSNFREGIEQYLDTGIKIDR